MIASSAIGRIMAIPKIKLPCKLTHRIIRPISKNGGLLFCSWAVINVPTQITNKGHTRMWGRASKWVDTAKKVRPVKKMA